MRFPCCCGIWLSEVTLCMFNMSARLRLAASRGEIPCRFRGVVVRSSGQESAEAQCWTVQGEVNALAEICGDAADACQNLALMHCLPHKFSAAWHI